tara:strand:+ start:378 stop:1835 length:1458 start_codon:yes stop_codon:yes gene_type:complete
MSTKDQSLALNDLWKLTEQSDELRKFLASITDFGTSYVEIRSKDITRQLKDAWKATNGEEPNDKTKIRIKQFAEAITKQWNTIVDSGHQHIIKEDMTRVRGSNQFIVKFDLAAGRSKKKGPVSGWERNNFKQFKRVNTEIVKNLLKGTFKDLTTGEKKLSKSDRATFDIGHINAVAGSGRADAALGLINGILSFDGLPADAKAELKAAKDSIGKLELNGVDEKNVNYNAGTYTFNSKVEYILETPKENRGKESDKEDSLNVVKILQKLLQDNGKNTAIVEFLNRKGSPSALDTVADMIINTPIKRKAYNSKKARNLSRFQKPLKQKSGRSKITKEKKLQGKKNKISGVFDSSMAALIPKSARPKKGKEGARGNSPEDFAQKIRNLLKVKRAINARLPAEIRRNMGKPALTNRTGTFSNSAEVTSILPAAQTLMVKYTYRLNPYETFENTGKNKWPSGYNPKPLIAKSIRGLALGLIDEKLTIRRS